MQKNMVKGRKKVIGKRGMNKKEEEVYKRETKYFIEYILMLYLQTIINNSTNIG
jgi:hypothetical protein